MEQQLDFEGVLSIFDKRILAHQACGYSSMKPLFLWDSLRRATLLFTLWASGASFNTMDNNVTVLFS